jgi:hypothetical protein
LEANAPLGSVNLIADNMQACEQLMLQGQAQFVELARSNLRR